MLIPDGKIDVLTVGECLIDLISIHPVETFADVSGFQKFFGGSPANIAIYVSKLGRKSAIITKVGNNGFGDFLLKSLKNHGVIVDYVARDPCLPTSIVFIIKSAHSPKFIAYRHADANLCPNDVKKELIQESKIVHVSSFVLCKNPSREAVLKTIKIAKKYGKIVSLDPNYRPALWPDIEEGRRVIFKAYEHVDITKPSLDDAKYLIGDYSPRKLIKKFHDLGPRIVLLTLGPEGCLLYDGRKMDTIPSYLVQSVETTGAGDSFYAGFFSGILDGKSYKQAAEFASVVAAITVSKMGAIVELPSKSELYQRVKEYYSNG